MKYGFLGTFQNNNRTEIVKDQMCRLDISEEDRNFLNYHLKLEKYVNYGVRISTLPLLYLLYRRRFFDKPSPFMIREIGLAVAGIVYIGGADWGINEYLWSQCHPVVKRIRTPVLESYTQDDEKAERAKKSAQGQKEKFYD